jgi:S1-C subfamily serine protease
LEVMREGQPEGSPPARIPCPHCREALDPLASVCPHCQRDASVDLVLDQPVLDHRLRYRLARSLVDLSPKPALGVWARHLERGGVIMRGVPTGVAEPVRARLSAAGLGASIRAHAAGAGGETSRWKAAAIASVAALVLLATVWLLRQWGPSRPAPARPGVTAVPQATGGPALSPREVAARVLPSVVVLRCNRQSGSGFFVTEHRVLTNEHVTCGRDSAIGIELADGRKGEGHLVVADERLDLALVETTLTGAALPAATAGDLETGDTVMAAGAPMGLERSFHVGTLSNPRRIMLGVCFLQIDAGINPGNSGGPLVDAGGRVVAVVSMKQNQAEGIAFAVPIDYAFDGEKPLLPPPTWHPSAGYQAMLAAARRDDERLLEESRKQRMQVVRAAPAGRGRVVAVVLSASAGEPEQLLSFRFEQQDRTICNVTGVATWRENQPDEGLAKRASDWMNRAGIGQVYSGLVTLDVQACEFERGAPIDLILEQGDEKTNRVTL